MKLINISNHPHTRWGKDQLESASIYSCVVDYPFPNVDPHCLEKDISLFADKIVEDVVSQYGTDIVVHLMGEFTLSYALIKRFRTKNIECLASCTERNVTENDKGEKVVVFNFVKFRKYE